MITGRRPRSQGAGFPGGAGRVRGILLPAVMVVLVWGMSLGPHGRALAGEGLVLGTAARAPLANKDQTGFVAEVTREAFRRIGVEAKVKLLPAERALLNADRGIDDGDLLRVGGLSKLYPNLLQAPENTMNFEFVVFTRKESFMPSGWPSGWHSLRDYNVGILTGWKILEQNITQARSLTKVSSEKQLFTLLDNNRADVIVYGKLQGLQYITDNNIKGVRFLDPPLAVREMFLYLHKKHQDLLPRFAAALRQMKADGTYKKIRDRALMPLFANN